MRLSIAAASAFALSVSASSLSGRQTVGDLPGCVTTCFATVDNGGCGLDFSCLCRNNTFVGQLAQCVYAQCPPDVVQGAIDSASQLCASQGVSVAIPQPSGSAVPSGSNPSAPSGSGSNPPPAPTASGSRPPAPTQSGNSANKNTLQVVTGVIAAGVAAVLV